MTSGGFRFEHFRLDPSNRLLTRGNASVELNGRYLDALTLLVSEHGKLVSKDRFMEEIWRGVPVTDEALTQCIKTLRRQLGDSAGKPRFIETVPKHGYRFIAPVERLHGDVPPVISPEETVRGTTHPWRQLLILGSAGTIGGGVAGVIGGLFYGFAGASQPLQAGMGAASVLLVLLCLTTILALAGAAGVSFGIATTSFARRPTWYWHLVGGAVGGLFIGGIVKLLGIDALNLLFGLAPANITGAPEGALLGGAVGVGSWWAQRIGRLSLRRAVPAAALVGGTAGMFIALSGGRLMGGSLSLLAEQFPGSRLRLDQIGGLFGENGLGAVSQVVTCILEGALFAGCIAGAMILARRKLGSASAS